MVSRVSFPNCRSGVIGLAIVGNPENDGPLSPWQEAIGHEIIPDTHKNGCANEATTGLTLGSSRRCFRTLRGSACRINKTGNDVELAAVEFDLDPPEHVMSLFSSPRLTRCTRGCLSIRVAAAGIGSGKRGGSCG